MTKEPQWFNLKIRSSLSFHLGIGVAGQITIREETEVRTKEALAVQITGHWNSGRLKTLNKPNKLIK